MSRSIRRLLAAAVGLVTAFLFIVWTYIGYFHVYWYAWEHLALSVPLSQARGPRPDAYDNEAQLYYGVLLGALLLASGGTTALMVLAPRSVGRVRAWIYVLFLAIILPASFFNYSQRDIVLRAPLQAGLNLVLIFLGAVVAIWLGRVRAQADDVRVLKYMTLALLLMAGVCVPALFTLVWSLTAIHVLSIPQSRDIGFAQLTGLGGVASAFIAGLNYRREKRKEAASTAASTHGLITLNP